VLLVIGHDFADAERSWAFTPGGGTMPGESSKHAALRELAEETGVHLTAADLEGRLADLAACDGYAVRASERSQAIARRMPNTCVP